VSGTGGHVKGGRHEDHPGAPQAHAAGQLLKAHIEADAQAHGAELSFKRGDGVAAGQGVRLEVTLAAHHVDVEQVDLAVLVDEQMRTP